MIPSGRLPRLLVGYLAACLAAALILPLGQIAHDALVLGPSRALGSAGIAGIWVIALFAFAILVVVAAPFAVGLVLFGAARGELSALIQTLYGAFSGLLVQAVWATSGMGNAARSNLAAFLLFAVVGAVAGLVFARVGAPQRRSRPPQRAPENR
ncbi:hypothetical protein [Prosthecomicrobium hirschii]|uniref:Uncharacterized protein n=1 Tax=Prosthecodimorpha hirschii TaxID=665126 RepID=A0A0N8GF98_9HYPH|nr:hypothetical protein [Prosthecomicrobium hirschii]KPL53721.1 hypothetical protein ABB55_17125 [Prosthecomicrobium hirschii]MCW1842842.1 hypothetical protein [Prosthecomicrobium hirschii]